MYSSQRGELRRAEAKFTHGCCMGRFYINTKKFFYVELFWRVYMFIYTYEHMFIRKKYLCEVICKLCMIFSSFSFKTVLIF
jgi:hypothetical protein